MNKRTHSKYAPVPTNYEPTPQRKSYTVKRVEEKPLRLSAYWMDMFEHTMRKFR